MIFSDFWLILGLISVQFLIELLMLCVLLCWFVGLSLCWFVGLLVDLLVVGWLFVGLLLSWFAGLLVVCLSAV